MTSKFMFQFTEPQKAAMLQICGKYPIAPNHHKEIEECLKVPGALVLFMDEALYLAGIIQPYYAFLADRLRALAGVAGGPGEVAFEVGDG